MEKRCTRCKEDKELSSFVVDNRSADGHGARCKECFNKLRRLHYAKNPSDNRKARIRTKKWRGENIEQVREDARKKYADDPEKACNYQKVWRKNNKDAISVRRKELNKKNAPVLREQRIKIYNNSPDVIERRASKKERKAKYFMQEKSNKRVRNGIRKSLKGSKRGRHWEDLVGYSKFDLIKHLENLFTEGMNWERFVKGEIHIDHKIPLAAFKFNGPDDPLFRKAWALDNLQPLWKVDNLRKGAKLNYEL